MPNLLQWAGSKVKDIKDLAFELMHPRGPDGRFIKKWGVSKAKADKVASHIASAKVRTFPSDAAAGQYAFNAHHAAISGKGKGAWDQSRFVREFGDVNDRIRAGKPDEVTESYSQMMDRNTTTLDQDLIVTRMVNPEALGLGPDAFTPKPLPEAPDRMVTDVENLTGTTIADAGYTSGGIGTEYNNPAGKNKIRMVMLTPAGTKVSFPGSTPTDRQVVYQREQPFLITNVDRDGQGGHIVYAMAMDAVPGETARPLDVTAGERKLAKLKQPRDKTLTSDQMTANLDRAKGEPLKRLAQQAGVSDAGTDEEIRARIRQAAAAPGRAPGTVSPAPAPAQAVPDNNVPGNVPAGPGAPAPRQESLQSEGMGGGAPAAPAAPGGAAPQTPGGGAPETPQMGAGHFRRLVQERDLPRPSSGKRRQEWNNAYNGIATGRKQPADMLRELETDIAVNRRRGDVDGTDTELDRDIEAQEALADAIAESFDLPRGARPESGTSRETDLPELTDAQREDLNAGRAVRSERANVPAPEEPRGARRPTSRERAEQRAQLRDTVAGERDKRGVTEEQALSEDELIRRGEERRRNIVETGESFKEIQERRRRERGAEPVPRVDETGTPEPEPEKGTSDQDAAKAERARKAAIRKEVRSRPKPPETKQQKADREEVQRLADRTNKRIAEENAAADKAMRETADPWLERAGVTWDDLGTDPSLQRAVVLLTADQLNNKKVSKKKAAERLREIGGDPDSPLNRIADQIEARAPRKAKPERDPFETETPVGRQVDVPPTTVPTPDAKTLRTLSGRNNYLADLIQEELDLDNPALNDRPMPGVSSPREILENLVRQYRIDKPEDKSNNFEDGYDLVLDHMSIRYGSGGPEGEAVIDTFRRIAQRYRANAPIKKSNATKLQERQAQAEARRIAKAAEAGEAPRLPVAQIPERIRVDMSPQAREVADYIQSFEAPPTREDAEARLLTLTAKEIQDIARESSLPGWRKMRKAELAKELAEATAGRRRDSIAVRGFTGERPGQEGPAVPGMDLTPRERTNSGWGGSPEDQATAMVAKFGRLDSPARMEYIENLGISEDELRRAAAVAGLPTRPDASRADLIEAWRKWTPEAEQPAPSKVLAETAKRPDLRLNPGRAASFEDALADEFMRSGKANFGAPEGSPADLSLGEITRGVSSGDLTPNQALEMLENDIELNQQEIVELERDARANPGLAQALRAQRAEKLEEIRAEERASKFLRKHFESEPDVTPAEVTEVAAEVKETVPEVQNFEDQLRNATPADMEAMREGIRQLGLGDIEGTTGEEIFDNAIRAIAKRELEDRAARKAAERAPKPKPVKATPPAPGKAYEVPNARAIAEGLDESLIGEGTMAQVQKELANPKNTPAAVGRMVDKWADANATANAIREFDNPDAYAEGRLRVEEQRKLATRLKATRRKRATAPTPEAPTLTPAEDTNLAEAARLTGIPEADLKTQAVDKKLEAAPASEHAKGVVDLLKVATSTEEAEKLLGSRPKAELVDIGKAAGLDLKMSKSKKSMVDDIVTNTQAPRQYEVLTRGGMRDETVEAAEGAPAGKPMSQGGHRTAGRTNLGRIQPGEKFLAEQNEKGEWRFTDRVTTGTPLEFVRREQVRIPGYRQGRNAVIARDADGNEIRIAGHYPGIQTVKLAPEPKATKVSATDRREQSEAVQAVRDAAREERMANLARRRELRDRALESLREQGFDNPNSEMLEQQIEALRRNDEQTVTRARSGGGGLNLTQGAGQEAFEARHRQSLIEAATPKAPRVKQPKAVRDAGEDQRIVDLADEIDNARDMDGVNSLLAREGLTASDLGLILARLGDKPGAANKTSRRRRITELMGRRIENRGKVTPQERAIADQLDQVADLLPAGPDQISARQAARDIRNGSISPQGARTRLVEETAGRVTVPGSPQATEAVTSARNVDEGEALKGDPEGDNMRMHGDSLTMNLAQAYAKAGRNGSANRMMDLRRRATARDGSLSPQGVVDELKAIRAAETDPNFQRQLDRAIDGIDAPMTPMPELPANTPPLARKLMEDLHAIPYARKGKGARGGGGTIRGDSLVDQLAQVYRDIAAGTRGDDGRSPSDRIRKIVREQTHESNEASFRLWDLERLIDSQGGKPSPLVAELRDWERGKLNTGTSPAAPAPSVPEGPTNAEIMRMNISDLRQLAQRRGIANWETLGKDALLDALLPPE